jgi:hypothetical protein
VKVKDKELKGEGEGERVKSERGERGERESRRRVEMYGSEGVIG